LSDFLQFSFAGLTIGAAYALVAVGFSIVYRGTGAINFMQGEYVMVAGVLAGLIHELFGPPLLLTVAVTLAASLLAGLLTELIGVRIVGARTADAITIVTIGLAVVLKAGTMIATGKRTFALPAFSGSEPIRVGAAALLPQTIWNVALVGLAAVLFTLFFRGTRRGVMLRAAADDRDAARMMGVSLRETTGWTFALAALLGGVAGVSLTPVTLMSFESGTLLGLKGFAAAMLGGIGSMPGSLVGGLLLGLAESLTAGYVSSQYTDVVAFAVLLLVLFARPTGLFGLAALRRV
jgi:branched-chain amino acid transport system permease protein